MEKTNKPIWAGVLAIASGVFGVIGAICYFIGYAVVSGAWRVPVGYIPEFVPALVMGTAILTAIFAILAIIGGIYSLQRKNWGMSLTGSIFAILSFLPLGIPAVILVAQAKNEFE